MNIQRVLLIDDDVDIFKLVERSLEGIFQVDYAPTSTSARNQINQNEYSVVIVDLYLESENGMTLIKEFKSLGLLENKKIFILTSEKAVEQEIEGHRIGVDEYIRKPINPKVFRAMTEKNALKLSHQNDDILKVGNLNISLSSLKVTLGEDNQENEVDLTGKEFKILVTLVRNKGNVMSREQLYQSIWEKETDNLQRTLDMHVSTLRKKLGEYGSCIKTIRSVGYKFVT